MNFQSRRLQGRSLPTVTVMPLPNSIRSPLVRPVRVSEVAVELKVWVTTEPAPVGVAFTV